MTTEDRYPRVGGPIMVGDAIRKGVEKDGPPVKVFCVDCGAECDCPAWIAEIVRSWNHKHHGKEEPINRREIIRCPDCSRGTR